MLRDAEKTIGNLIDKQRVAFISSVDEDGFPNTRAMLPPRERVGIKTLYFSTNTSSAKVGQYRDNPKTCVCVPARRSPRWRLSLLASPITRSTRPRAMAEKLSVAETVSKSV